MFISIGYLQIVLLALRSLNKVQGMESVSHSTGMTVEKGENINNKMLGEIGHTPAKWEPTVDMDNAENKYVNKIREENPIQTRLNKDSFDNGLLKDKFVNLHIAAEERPAEEIINQSKEVIPEIGRASVGKECQP